MSYEGTAPAGGEFLDKVSEAESGGKAIIQFADALGIFAKVDGFFVGGGGCYHGVRLCEPDYVVGRPLF